MRLLALLALPALLAAESKLQPVDETSYKKLVASHRGKILMVDFWATWCTPCRAELPHLAQISAKLQAKGLDFVTVSADELENEPQALQFLEKSGVKGGAFVKRPKNDDAFIEGINPEWGGGMPALFLYDRNGKLVKSFFGETPIKDIESALGKLL